MQKIICFLTLFIFLLASSAFAEKVIWKGKVSANGTPSEVISLDMHKQYTIHVHGYVNLGKWVKGGEKLANDACFEFNKTTKVSKAASLENSLYITVCDGLYHLDHVYQSQPFIAKKNRVHFWVNDTYYDDNTGEFEVEVIQLD